MEIDGRNRLVEKSAASGTKDHRASSSPGTEISATTVAGPEPAVLGSSPVLTTHSSPELSRRPFSRRTGVRSHGTSSAGMPKSSCRVDIARRLRPGTSNSKRRPRRPAAISGGKSAAVHRSGSVPQIVRQDAGAESTASATLALAGRHRARVTLACARRVTAGWGTPTDPGPPSWKRGDMRSAERRRRIRPTVIEICCGPPGTSHPTRCSSPRSRKIQWRRYSLSVPSVILLTTSASTSDPVLLKK